MAINVDIIKIQEAFYSRTRNLKTVLQSNCTPTHLYTIGVTLILFFLLLFPINKNIYFFEFYVSLGSALLSFGLIWESFKFIKRLGKENIIISFFLGIPGSTIVAAISAVLASQLINQATGMDPNQFKYSTTILTTFCLPIVIAYAIAIILAVGYTIWFPFQLLGSFLRSYVKLFLLNPVEKPKLNLLHTGRAFAAIALSTQTFLFLDTMPRKVSNEIMTGTKLLVILADFYSHGPCSNIKKHERFRFADKDNINVAGYKDGIFYFTTRKCIKM